MSEFVIVSRISHPGFLPRVLTLSAEYQLKRIADFRERTRTIMEKKRISEAEKEDIIDDDEIESSGKDGEDGGGNDSKELSMAPSTAPSSVRRRRSLLQEGSTATADDAFPNFTEEPNVVQTPATDVVVETPPAEAVAETPTLPLKYIDEATANDVTADADANRGIEPAMLDPAADPGPAAARSVTTAIINSTATGITVDPTYFNDKQADEVAIESKAGSSDDESTSVPPDFAPQPVLADAEAADDALVETPAGVAINATAEVSTNAEAPAAFLGPRPVPVVEVDPAKVIKDPSTDPISPAEGAVLPVAPPDIENDKKDKATAKTKDTAEDKTEDKFRDEKAENNPFTLGPGAELGPAPALRCSTIVGVMCGMPGVELFSRREYPLRTKKSKLPV